MKRFYLAIVIIGVIAMVALAGCGGGGGGSSAGGQIPDPIDDDNNTNVLTGRVVAHDNKAGLAGVTISFGNPVISATTGADGRFTINLGQKTPAQALVGGNIFSINTSSVDGGFYRKDDAVAYSKSPTPVFYSQDNLPVPQNVIIGQDKDLGIITTQPSHEDDVNNPPGPPFFEGNDVPANY